MVNWSQSKLYYPFLIIVSLILAIVFYSGIVLKEDKTGRIIIGTVWLIVSIGWLSRYATKNKIKRIAEK